MSGFKQFLLRGNLIDLAVGFVIGAAFTTVVTALVSDLITPLIAAIGGKPNFSQFHFTVNHAVFKYGDFIDAVISFIIVAAVLYFLVVRPFSAFAARFSPPPEPEPQTRDCPHCLMSVPAAATRCGHCTADLEPAKA